jgi:hypothetical protein
MARAIRTAVVAFLMAGIASLPIVADQCTMSCDAHQIAAAATPPCHHVHATGAHLGQTPSACQHDHDASIGALQNVVTVPERSFGAIAWGALPESAVIRACPAHVVLTDPPPGAGEPAHARTLPLRV